MPGVRQTNTGVVETESGVAQTEIASSTTTIIEDFEDNTLADWDYNQSSTWQITSTNPIEGSYSVLKTSESGLAVSLGDVANHTAPGLGETYSLRWRENNDPSNNQLNIYRGTDTANPSNSAGHYQLMFTRDSSPATVVLNHTTSSKTTLQTVDWSHTAGTVYEIQWHITDEASPVHTIDVIDTSTSTTVTSINVTDTNGNPMAGTGLGFFAHFNWDVVIDSLTAIS